MFFLNFTFKKYHRFFKPKIFCLFIAFNQVYTTFVFHYLTVEEDCFPPTLYLALEHLTFAVAAVSVVTGLILWVALLSKKFKPKLYMGFLLVQHISILYSCVTGLLLYGTNYSDVDHCYMDEFFLGLSILLAIWDSFVYICVNSYRGTRLQEEEKNADQVEASSSGEST
ncbi:unnamed protein product [Arctia plantaginis]|uniref:Uncharacterized protein n=1 Tax=Arctia plantaginis TaxID=874455 RepID=A0A8S1BGI3_ARCPL|nr:unnamed protein product [Arctia plantaginis]